MIVCIDPGHGGPDPGTLGRGGIREADIVLDISKHLGRYLSQAGVNVVYTRSTDTDLAPGVSDTEELKARCDRANRSGASLFVSVHADAFTYSSVRGIRCFYYPTSTRGQASAKAMADTLRVMVQIAGASQNMASISSANYYVLKYTHMPAVLVETGFMTNEADLALLCESSYRDKVGLLIALGILRTQEKGLSRSSVCRPPASTPLAGTAERSATNHVHCDHVSESPSQATYITGLPHKPCGCCK